MGGLDAHIFKKKGYTKCQPWAPEGCNKEPGANSLAERWLGRHHQSMVWQQSRASDYQTATMAKAPERCHTVTTLHCNKISKKRNTMFHVQVNYVIHTQHIHFTKSPYICMKNRPKSSGIRAILWARYWRPPGIISRAMIPQTGWVLAFRISLSPVKFDTCLF